MLATFSAVYRVAPKRGHYVQLPASSKRINQCDFWLTYRRNLALNTSDNSVFIRFITQWRYLAIQSTTRVWRCGQSNVVTSFWGHPVQFHDKCSYIWYLVHTLTTRTTVSTKPVQSSRKLYVRVTIISPLGLCIIRSFLILVDRLAVYLSVISDNYTVNIMIYFHVLLLFTCVLTSFVVWCFLVIFAKRIVNTWNSLPDSFVLSKSAATFRHKVNKLHFFWLFW